jgi:hypothetical protein
MANQDAAFGFRPTRSLVGGQIRTEEYAIAANYNTAIYTGQVVEAVAAGGIEAAAAEDTQVAGFLVACSTQIPLQVNQHGKLIIQQALMLLILKLPYMQIQKSYMKHNTMVQEQQR